MSWYRIRVFTEGAGQQIGGHNEFVSEDAIPKALKGADRIGWLAQSGAKSFIETLKEVESVAAPRSLVLIVEDIGDDPGALA